jgi:hypothetical protein
MAKVIPMYFDASNLTHLQTTRKIREMGWSFGRFNIREMLKNERMIVVRVKR